VHVSEDAARADLALSKTASQDLIAAGNVCDYTILPRQLE
jgi:hypothetical protein